MLSTNQIKKMKNQVNSLFEGAEIEHYVKDEMLFISISSPKNKLVYNFSKGNSQMNLTIGVKFEDNDLVFKHFDLMESGNVIESDIHTSIDSFDSLEESSYELLSQYKYKKIEKQLQKEGILNLIELSESFKNINLNFTQELDKYTIESPATDNSYTLNINKKDKNIEFSMYLNEKLITQSKKEILDTEENRVGVFSEFAKISINKDHQKLLYLSENSKLSESLNSLSMSKVVEKVLKSKNANKKQ
jgi:hypothetical protein